MPSDCLEKGFVCGEATEVERLAPGFFVKSGCKVVVAILKDALVLHLASAR